MAKRDPKKGVKNAAKLGALGGGAVGVGNVAAGGAYETFVPAVVRGIDGQMVHTAVSHIVPATMTPLEGIGHIAATTGIGALGSAAIVGAVHLGLKAWDRFRGDNMNPNQFK